MTKKILYNDFLKKLGKLPESEDKEHKNVREFHKAKCMTDELNCQISCNKFSSSQKK